MSEPKPTTAVEKKDASIVEYVPYGAQDKIKLNIGIVQNLIAVKTKSGKTCSDRDALKFLAMCQARRLNPFEGDAFLIGYDGKDGPSFALITAHQTYLKRAELHPEFDGMKSGIIILDVNKESKDLEGDFYSEGDEVVGGWATVFFKTRKQPMHKRLRLARFQKPFGIWQEDPAGMICKCAEADALRSAFPTMLGGLYMREEVEAQVTTTSKPEFSEPSKTLFMEPKPEPVQQLAEPDPEDLKKSPGPAVEPEPANPTPRFNPLKALRNHTRMAGITEAQLLDYMAATGASDGASSTLDELALISPELIEHSVKHWPELSAKIKEQLKREEAAK